MYAFVAYKITWNYLPKTIIVYNVKSCCFLKIRSSLKSKTCTIFLIINPDKKCLHNNTNSSKLSYDSLE